jgi:signal transduction histidine kinase
LAVNHSMEMSNDSPNPLKQVWSSAWSLLRSIRAKVILPYVILTLLVAFAGTFIVATLVEGSLRERLENQLADAADLANDEVALFEVKLLSQLRALTFLQGSYEAMRDDDIQALQDLLVPSIANSDIRRTVITDLNGDVVLDIVKQPGKADPQVDSSLTGRNISVVPLVQRVLGGLEDEYGERHTGLIEIEDELFLAIGGPFRLYRDPKVEGGKLVGVVMVAEPLQSLLDQVKEASVARRVTVYGPDGQVVATTFGEDEPRREDLAITPEFFQSVIADQSQTPQRERVVSGRHVRFAYFAFLMRHQVFESLGVMSVGIGSSHVLQTGTSARLRFSVIFSLAVLGVIGIGYVVSRRIIRPIMRLVETSRAVAGGDLTQRTGIQSDDELGTLAVTFDDMTQKLEQRTADLERLLREKREEASRVQAILSSIAEGILMEDRNSQIALPMNPAAHEILELLSEQFTALKPVREIDTAGDARHFEIGDCVISVETSPVLMPDGKQLGKVLVLRDITTETEVDRLKDEFIAQISHELRTPLTSIKGYSDLLSMAMGGLSEQQRNFLGTINRHAESLEDMIADLLDFTQLEAGNLGLRFEPMSLETVVQQVAQKWADRFEEKDIDFAVHIDGPIPQMLGDEGRLRRALDNLVENACNYTEDGEARVSLSADDHSVTVAVTDTGVGITPEDQAHLFTRFYRVPLERTIDVRGMGVDLYVTKAIVEGHSGQIWVESERGRGSTFTFTLPLDAGARDQKPPDESFTDLGEILR